MSNESQGNKTEQATPKRLRDARKKGDVAKSRDISNTLLLGFFLLLFWFTGQEIGSQIISFTSEVLQTAAGRSDAGAMRLGAQGVDLMLSVSVKIFLPLLVAALLIEFIQTGPIFALDKVKPKLSNISMATGFKRIFSVNSIVELIKAVIKAVAIFVICIFISMHVLRELPNLIWFQSEHLAVMMKSQTDILFGAAFVFFSLLAVMDLCYQKYNYAVKMKMSVDEVKREHKNSEGDPQIKGQRQQLSREWAMEGAAANTRNATVLVVNPTHIAVALSYDEDHAPAPTVIATGTDKVALAMREAARQAKVPVLKNIQVARALHAQTKSGDIVPREMFSVIAEVIVWSQSISARLHGKADDHNGEEPELSTVVPGEDLTVYSEPSGGAL